MIGWKRECLLLQKLPSESLRTVYFFWHSCAVRTTSQFSSLNCQTGIGDYFATLTLITSQFTEKPSDSRSISIFLVLIMTDFQPPQAAMYPSVPLSLTNYEVSLLLPFDEFWLREVRRFRSVSKVWSRAMSQCVREIWNTVERQISLMKERLLSPAFSLSLRSMTILALMEFRIRIARLWLMMSSLVFLFLLPWF